MQGILTHAVNPRSTVKESIDSKLRSVNSQYCEGRLREYFVAINSEQHGVYVVGWRCYLRAGVSVMVDDMSTQGGVSVCGGWRC